MFKSEQSGISIGCFLEAFGKITPGVYVTILAHQCVLTIVTPSEVFDAAEFEMVCTGMRQSELARWS